MSTPAVETPIAKSSAVVQSDQNVKSIEDKLGAQTTRSGQTVDANFTDAVIASYSNLMHAPLLAAIFFGLLAVTLAEYLETKDGPLEQLYNALLLVVKANKNKIFVTIARILLLILKFLISQKQWVLNVMLISVPYFRKPSTKNLQITLVFSILAIVFESNYFTVLLFSQAWFLITELRNPKFKMIIGVIIAVVFLLSWLEVDSLEPPKPTTRPQNDANLDRIRTSPILSQEKPVESNDPNYRITFPLPTETVEDAPSVYDLQSFTKLDVSRQLKAIFEEKIPFAERLAFYRVAYTSITKKEPPNVDENKLHELLKNLRIKKNL